jgi:hypothetical protein
MADCNDDIGKLAQEATAGTPEGDMGIAQQVAKLSFSDSLDIMVKASQRKECFVNGNELEVVPSLDHKRDENLGSRSSWSGVDIKLERIENKKEAWFPHLAPIVEQILYPNTLVLGADGYYEKDASGNPTDRRENIRVVTGPDGKVIPDSVQK